MTTIGKYKVVHRNGGPVKLDKTTNIYQLNTHTGKVSKAEMIETGRGVYKLIEFDGCIYLPCASLEIASATFATILQAGKEGRIKLSWRERIAKWWTVFTIKYRRLSNWLNE